MENENVLFLAGQIIGMTLRVPAWAYQQAAATRNLRPEYAEAIRFLAGFRSALGGRDQYQEDPTP